MPLERTVQSLILERIADLKEHVLGINARLDVQNNRVGKAEVAVGRLQWAVFGGGAAIAAGLWYLVVIHMK